MAVDFRCDKCGKLLSVEAASGESVKCPHCGQKSAVPAGLASLPRPQLADQSAPIAPTEAGLPIEEPAEQSDAVMNVLAYIMPWVISAFFHLGLALIMMLATVITMEQKAAAVKAPEAAKEKQSTEIRQTKEQGNRSKTPRDARQPTPTNKRDFSMVESEKPIGDASREAPALIGRAGGGGSEGGSLAATGLRQPGGAPGDPGMFGKAVRAEYVVYVIDKSGSMNMGGKFEILKGKLVESISTLSETKMFHLIFFGAEKQGPLENPPRRLVDASDENKERIGKFLDTVVPKGATLVLPALERAFAVLKTTGDPKSPKVIFLLSDGDFKDMPDESSGYKGLSGNEAVIAWLKDNNTETSISNGDGTETKRRFVRVDTFLYGAEDPESEKVMRQIAQENDGEFRRVSLGE